MAGRIRSIKPEAFKDAKLWDAEAATGLPLFRAYAALWCQADKEGRFVWKPRELKIECLPYWEGDFGAVLEALVEHGFVRRYVTEGGQYGWIPTFKKHQHINGKEPASRLPEPVTLVEVPKPSGRVHDVSQTCASREADAPIHIPTPSQSLPDPDPSPDPAADAGDEPGPPAADKYGRFRMHSGWKPSDASVSSVLVSMVEAWAVPIYVGQFTGHFAATDEKCQNTEWNQRWVKWVNRDWFGGNRPKRPADEKPAEADLEARSAAMRARHDARVAQKTEEAKAFLARGGTPPRDISKLTGGIG